MAAEATASGREGGGIVKLMDVNDFDDADKWTDISEDDERGFDPAEGYRDDSGKTFALVHTNTTGWQSHQAN